MLKTPVISVVIPLYNEEETLPNLSKRLKAMLDSTDIPIEVILVNDGSRDDTEVMLREIGMSDERFQIVLLSRNFGHQLAVSAGLSFVNGSEAVFILDGDLQDPPELLFDFYKKLKEGYDVVYGVRKKRKEGVFKRMMYYIFYRLMKSISSIDIPLDSGDFSMISRRVANYMNKMPEESRYLRGMRAWVGFKQTKFEYERDARMSGESKYSYKLLFKLAYNGIFNFSEFPIKLITKLGLLSFLTTIIYISYTLIKVYVLGAKVPEGFTGLLVVISLFGSVILLSIGIIGEYVTRLFFQSKQRPLYIVEARIADKKIINE
jgi:dolichol-phosphate mannosyltransferase